MVTCNLPRSYRELLREINSKGIDHHSPDEQDQYIIQLAKEFQSLKSCSHCGEPMIDEEKFIEEVEEYYNVNNADEINLLLFQGSRLMDQDHSDLCRECGNQLQHEIEKD